MITPFFGRQGELERLSAVGERVRRERAPGAVVLIGEPGTGKTRLLTEAVGRLRFGQTISAVGFEPMQSLPLGAAGDLLRELCRVPEAGETLERLILQPAPASAGNPLRILEAAHRALAGQGAMLLAIDDLQWFDEASLSLLHYLLRAAYPQSQSLLVIACARPSAAAAALRTGIASDLPAQRRAVLELGPLDLEAGISLVQSVDPRADQSAAAELWRRARGSPFWLEALARYPGTEAGTPLLEERLATLSVEAAELLAVLAVVGHPFDLQSVAAGFGQRAEQVKYAARQLIARGLVVQGPGYVRLAHDLIREEVMRGLPRSSRRRIEASLAAQLETAAGDEVQALVEALEHRVAAGLPAGELATRILASPRRRQLSGANLRLLASISDSMGPTERAGLDAAIGSMAAAVGDQELAEERWDNAGRLSIEPDRRALAEIEAAGAAFALGRRDEVRAHVTRARAMPALTDEAALRLAAVEAKVELWLDNDTAGGTQTAEDALRVARDLTQRVGGVHLLAPGLRSAYLSALEAATDAAMQQGRSQDMLRLSEESVEVARGPDEEAYVRALMQAGVALRHLGRIRESGARYRKAAEIAERAVLPMQAVEIGQRLASALRDLGDLEEARSVAAQAVELESRRRVVSHPWNGPQVVLHSIDLYFGNPRAALLALRQDSDEERDPHYRLGIHQTIASWLARSAGERVRTEVEGVLEAARAEAELARCPRCSGELAIVSVEVLARIGRVSDAMEALVLWEGDDASRRADAGRLRIRGQASVAMAGGDRRTSANLLEALAQDLQSAGLLTDLLWVWIDLGRLFETSERDRSINAFTEAAQLADQLGAIYPGRLAAQALRRLGVRAWRRGRAGTEHELATLSEREREVSRLIADGLSNAEIGNQLLISPKTVERHVTNILTKLSLRNRTEVASLARSQLVRVSPDD